MSTIEIAASKKLTALGHGLVQFIGEMEEMEQKLRLLTQENEELKAENDYLKSKNKGLELRIALAGAKKGPENGIENVAAPVVKTEAVAPIEVAAPVVKTEAVAPIEVASPVVKTEAVTPIEVAAPVVKTEAVAPIEVAAPVVKTDAVAPIEVAAAVVKTDAVVAKTAASVVKNKKTNSWAEIAKNEQEERDATISMMVQRMEDPNVEIVDSRPFEIECNKKGFNVADAIIKKIEELAETNFNYPTDWTCDYNEPEYRKFTTIGGLVHRLEEVFFDVEENTNIKIKGEGMLKNAVELLFNKMTRDEVFKYEKLGKKEICVLTPTAILSMERVASDTDINDASFLIGKYINSIVNPRLIEQKTKH